MGRWDVVAHDYGEMGSGGTWGWRRLGVVRNGDGEMGVAGRGDREVVGGGKRE